MKKIALLLIAVIFGYAIISCNSRNSEQNKPEKVVSFDPGDSALVNDLMNFYISEHIIPKEALKCNHETNGGRHTFNCLSDDCFISNDFIDSLNNVFFTEITFHPGSSGDNDIYICYRDNSGFHIRYNLEGQIMPDLGHEMTKNGCKVLYICVDKNPKRLIYNGKEFVLENMNDSQPASQN